MSPFFQTTRSIFAQHFNPTSRKYTNEMAHLSNPLATTRQLLGLKTANALPPELQDCIRFYTARLTQAAGILLGLPQDIIAQAIVTLQRYWLVDHILAHEFSVRSTSSPLKTSSLHSLHI